MRNRNKQRDLKAADRKEERLEKYNEYGLKDLTPYNAVQKTLNKEIAYK